MEINTLRAMAGKQKTLVSEQQMRSLASLKPNHQKEDYNYSGNDCHSDC